MEMTEVQLEENGVNAKNDEVKRGADILYGIDDIPPWYLSIPMAFQVYFDSSIARITSDSFVMCTKFYSII